jgi:hypothetical protein
MTMKLLNKDQFNKIEPFLFLLFLVAGTIPLLYFRHFVTLDGPAHLYNANLIKEIWFGGNPAITDLFRINPFPVPNWSGHFIMALLHVFLPAYLSEKIVLLFYFLLTPLFFRKFLLQFYPDNRLITYFMLLFVHNHNLYFGFINMSLGITFLFITGYYFVRYCKEFQVKNGLILTLFLLIIYFSHILILLITIMVLVVAVMLLAKTEKTTTGIKVVNAKELKIRMVNLIIATIPVAVLSVIYFLSIDSVEKGTRMESAELIRYITCVRPLLTYCFCDSWIIMTHILFVLFVIMILSNIYLLVKESCKVEHGHLLLKRPVKLSYIWFFISAGFLALFLIMPNAILMSERLIVLFYLFFIIWLASLKYTPVIRAICLLVVIMIDVFFISVHFDKIQKLSKDAGKIVQAGEMIKPNSMVLTLNYSDNWLHSHITGYLGSNNNIAILENYEAALTWFPVQWKQNEYQIDRLIAWGVDNKKIAYDLYVNKEDSVCFSLKKSDGQIKRIPYVFVLGNMDEKKDNQTLTLKSILNSSYDEIQTTDLSKLYELKNKN